MDSEIHVYMYLYIDSHRAVVAPGIIAPTMCATPDTDLRRPHSVPREDLLPRLTHQRKRDQFAARRRVFGAKDRQIRNDVR